MKLTLTGAALLLLACPVAVLAQGGAPAGPLVVFPQVTDIAIPLQSTSGRFSSLKPANWRSCSSRNVTGRVVSTRLIMVSEGFCGRGLSGNVLVNVAFSNPADAGQMVVGRKVTIAASFKSAEESRTPDIYANYLIAQKARLVAADPPGAPAPAFTSYMVCQPPELDALASRLGSELCVQSTLLTSLAAAGPALEKAARAPVKAPPREDLSGNPDEIICLVDLERSDIHLSALACARSSYWSWYQTKWRDYLFATSAPP